MLTKLKANTGNSFSTNFMNFACSLVMKYFLPWKLIFMWIANNGVSIHEVHV